MPRRILRRVAPCERTLRERWYLRPFAAYLADPRLWSPQRRAVTGAFGAGLAICFVPLPVHLPLAALAAIVWRLNVPAILATVLLVNPLTAVPVYYLAYRVGAALLGTPATGFAFEPSWEWLQHGLGPMWKPFLVGCLACAVAAGTLGRLALEALWRWRVLERYRARRAVSTA